MSDKDVELISVTKRSGVVEFVYKNEEDFSRQAELLQYRGNIGVVKTHTKVARVFAHNSALYKFEKSV